MEGVLPGPVGDFVSRTEAPAMAERLAGLGYRVLIMESAERPWAVLLQNILLPLPTAFNTSKELNPREFR